MPEPMDLGVEEIVTNAVDKRKLRRALWEFTPVPLQTAGGIRRVLITRLTQPTGDPVHPTGPEREQCSFEGLLLGDYVFTDNSTNTAFRAEVWGEHTSQRTSITRTR